MFQLFIYESGANYYMLHIKFYFDKHASNKMNKDESWLYNQRKIILLTIHTFTIFKVPSVRLVAQVVVSLQKLSFLERTWLVNSCKFRLEFRINSQNLEKYFGVPQFSYNSLNEIIKTYYLNGV